MIQGHNDRSEPSVLSVPRCTLDAVYLRKASVRSHWDIVKPRLTIFKTDPAQQLHREGLLVYAIRSGTGLSTTHPSRLKIFVDAEEIVIRVGIVDIDRDEGPHSAAQLQGVQTR